MRTETSYMGLRLAHPFIAGASPLGYRVDTIKRLEDAGCAAVVLHSLFEEQIQSPTAGSVGPGAAARSFAPHVADHADRPGAVDYPQGPCEYAQHISRAKQAVAIPIIASLNGCTGEPWLRFAEVIE